MKPLRQHAFSLTSVCVLHLRLKLPSGDANDSGGCYHMSPSDICALTHTCKDSCYFLWLRACVHLLLDRSVYLPVVMSQLLSLLFFCLPPFLPPCNLTPSTLVSCLLANRDCSRLGLDFPVLTSPLFCFIFQSISTPTPHSLTHAASCVSPPPCSPFSCVISKNMCVFRKLIPLIFPLLSLLKSQTVFLFPTSD